MRTFLYLPGKFSKVMMEVDLKAYNFPWHMANPDTPTPRDGAHKNDAKDFSPLAIFGTMVEKPVMDSETETGLPRRIGANVKSLYALTLDYDSGLSIDEFIATHKDLRFSLYTSYSHGQKERDRYRVVVPLAKELPCDLLECRRVRNNLAFHFPGVDECCFHRGHWQLLPLVNPEFRHMYRWERNPGNAWDFDLDTYEEWKEQEDRERQERLEASAADMDDASTETIVRWTIEKLGQIPVGSGVRHKEALSLLGWAKGKVGDAVYSIPCPWDDEKWQRQWPSLVRWVMER